jgi:hypothetical protein
VNPASPLVVKRVEMNPRFRLKTKLPKSDIEKINARLAKIEKNLKLALDILIRAIGK